ncbi:MAG: hypothetical protein HRT61_12835 [Ekhidna sp.]|nr:hypothetical protein [Ekhidna sp.]
MDLKNHENNLRIIGKIFIVIGLVLVPISISTFFFVDMFVDSDLWMEIRELDVVLFELRPPAGIAYFLPTVQTVGSIIFLVSGYGLATEQRWGNNLAMIPAVLLLFKFPVGTALGVYIIYAIHHEPKEQELVEADELA